MSDLDEFLQVVGTYEGREICGQKGCNKHPATMEEALAKEHKTAACEHCFRIYVPGPNDRSPRVTKRYKENKSGIHEYDAEEYEDGTKKIIFTVPAQQS